jgi:hypothetical protein
MTAFPPLAFTIARAVDSSVLAKRIMCVPDGSIRVVPYDSAVWFTFEAATAPGIRELGRKLYTLARDPRVALVRGEPHPHVKPGKCYFRRARAGDNTNSLIDRPCAWAAIDYDDVSAPGDLDWQRDPQAAAAYLQSLSPPELHGVDHVLQWSGSAGFTGANLIRARAWYGFTASLADDDLRRWAMDWNVKAGSRLIDFALFNPAQLHYVANPILASGISDPLSVRWHFIEGVIADRASIVLPPLPPPSAHVSQSSEHTLRPGGGLGAWLDRIGSIEWGFKEAIIAAVGAAVRISLERRLTLTAIRTAVLAADPGHRTPDVIARYASERFISAAFDRFLRQDAARRLAQARADFAPVPASSVTGWRRWDQYRAEGAAIAAMGRGGPAAPR